MKTEELKIKSIEELNKLVLTLREDLRSLYFKQAQRELKDISKINKVRKEIARVMTILNMKNKKNK